MRLRTWVNAAAIALALIMTASLGLAVAQDYTLKRTEAETQAIGEATVRQYGPVRSDRILSIDVFRLKPGSVYSVWLSRGGKRSPAGLKGKNFFETDGSGNAHYTDMTDEYELSFHTLEIAYHPDGEISNTSEMVIVLTTRLY